MAKGNQRDYYEVLGVTRAAAVDQIKSAYRKSALQWYPDGSRETKPDGEVNFGECSEAYGVLSGAQMRQIYDAYGHAAVRFVCRIASRMPFQRRFAVRGLDFVDRCGACDAQNFVVIPLISLGHGNSRSPLVRCFFRCGIGMHRYTHHCGTQHASMKHISRLQHLKNGAVLVVRCFRAIYGLMQMGIK